LTSAGVTSWLRPRFRFADRNHRGIADGDAAVRA
jgi:hypothetical protein